MNHRLIAKSLLKQMSLSEKISLLSTHQSPIEHLGIGEYHIGGEAAHGVVDRQNIATTCFPIPLALSQTWQPDLLKKMGEVIGIESRILYQLHDKKNWLTPWAPTIDMARDPRWGRNEEAYGEDPYLVGELSKALIKGIQGEDETFIQVAAAPKHFYANNNEYLRESSSNSIDERSKYEYYLKAFEPSFTEAKAQSMMTAYNGINGYPGMQNPDVQKIVKEKWQMDGYVVSDGGALTLNAEEYHYYDNYAEAIADTLKSGVDCIVDDKILVEESAHQAYQEGLLTDIDIDRAVENILTVRSRLGHFSQATPFDSYDPALLNSEKHHLIAKEITDETIVMLKNTCQLLPLAPQPLKVFGILGQQILRDWYGGIADQPVSLVDELNKRGQLAKYYSGNRLVKLRVEANYLSLDDNGANIVISADQASIFELEDWGNHKVLLKDCASQRYVAFSDDQTLVLNNENVYDWFVTEKFAVKGETICNWQGQTLTTTHLKSNSKNITPLSLEYLTDETLNYLEKVQKDEPIIVVAGNHPMINGKECEDRVNLDLPDRQQWLIKQLSQKTTNLILVLITSYPYDLTLVSSDVTSILVANHGSEALGESLVDLLFGKIAPTGKLSQTWPLTIDNLPDIREYNIWKYPRTYHYLTHNIQYPFGYGLTYGELEVLDLSLNQSALKIGEKLEIKVSVKNTSEKSVKETLQFYIAYAEQKSLSLPVSKLIDFKKISLAPSEERTFTVSVDSHNLTYWNVATKQYCLPKQEAQIYTGFHSQDIRISRSLQLLGEEQSKRAWSGNFDLLSYDDYHLVIREHEQQKQGVAIEYGGYLIYYKVINEEDATYKLRYQTFADTFCTIVYGEYTTVVPLLKHTEEVIVSLPINQQPTTLKIQTQGSVFFYQ